MTPETIFILLLFVIVTVPVFIGAIALVNRATSDDTEEELARLRERVEQLEAEQN